MPCALKSQRPLVDILMHKPKMILIDVDGTLVDSVPDLAYCVDRMMEQLGREPRGEQRVRDWVLRQVASRV